MLDTTCYVRSLWALWPWHRTPAEYAETVVERFSEDLAEKYAAGQQEHGGHLPLKPALKHLRQEVLDMAVYVTVVNDQINLAKRRLILALDPIWSKATKDRFMREVLNLLEHGNVSGLDEEAVNRDFAREELKRGEAP